jgi:NADPH oxidase
MVEIQFRQNSFKYRRPGQWLFIRVPSVSKHQWQPFPITSCPFDSYISIYVPPIHGFNTHLRYALGAGPAQAKLYEGLSPAYLMDLALMNGQQMPSLYLKGPYGILPRDIFADKIAILIAHGNGMTAWASFLRHLWHIRGNIQSMSAICLRRVEFFWVCGDMTCLEWFLPLLLSLEEQDNFAGRSPGPWLADFLRIHIYLTEEFDIDAISNIMLNSEGTNRDPLTGLKSFTNFGRPNFLDIFGNIRNGILDGTYLNSTEEDILTVPRIYFYGSSTDITSPSLGNRSLCSLYYCLL